MSEASWFCRREKCRPPLCGPTVYVTVPPGTLPAHSPGQKWKDRVGRRRASWVWLECYGTLLLSPTVCKSPGWHKKGGLLAPHSCFRTGSGWRSACHLRVLFLFSVVTTQTWNFAPFFCSHIWACTHTCTHSHLNKTSGWVVDWTCLIGVEIDFKAVQLHI